MAEEQVQVNEDMVQHLSNFPGAAPGQSLTNSPEQSMPWEQPPTYTTMHEALYGLFDVLTEEEMLQNIILAISNSTPIVAIAKAVLMDGFQKGAWNPDLLLQLIEPTMYMIMSIAEKAGVQYRIDEEDDLNVSEADSEEEMQLLNQLLDVSKQRIRDAGGKTNMPRELLKKVKDLEVPESLLSKAKGKISDPRTEEEEEEEIETAEAPSLLEQRG